MLGYGREGKSTHAYLIENHPEKRIGIADKNPDVTVDLPAEEIYLGEDWLSHLESFDVIVRSPGIPFKLPELQRAIEGGKKVTSETNIFFSECPGLVIGITGTKGKSTTSALISDILKRGYDDVRLLGNIGNPPLDGLPEATEKTLFVLELSSYQLEDARYSPSYAVVLGIKQEHLDRYGTFKNYVAAKTNVVRHQKVEDYVIYNDDDPSVEPLTNSTSAIHVTFSMKDGNSTTNIRGGKIYYHFEGIDTEIMDISEIRLLGKGNLENVLAAITVGMLFNVDPKLIKEAVKEFKSLEHRIEYVGEKNGIRFYDDSIATIPEAAINAIDAFGQDVETLIAGGFDRGIDFSSFGEFLANHPHIKNLILFPDTGVKIWKALTKYLGDRKMPQRFDVSTMREAIAIALESTSPGKICLLSPASPSFGIFRDFIDRGNQFKSSLKIDRELD